MTNNIFPDWTLAPDAFRALKKFTEVVENGSVDKRLQNLIYLRISQINGCEYGIPSCMDMILAIMVKHQNESIHWPHGKKARISPVKKNQHCFL